MTFFQSTESKLPQDFAMKVMELQMQMEFQESSILEVVQQLSDLYRIAIEHYVNGDPRKLTHFQRKLTALLTHPNTLQAIENRHPPQQEKRVCGGGGYEKILKHQLNKFNSESGALVRSMMEGSEMKALNSTRVISQNINHQEAALMRRLEGRSKSKPFKMAPR